MKLFKQLLEEQMKQAELQKQQQSFRFIDTRMMNNIPTLNFENPYLIMPK